MRFHSREIQDNEGVLLAFPPPSFPYLMCLQRSIWNCTFAECIAKCWKVHKFKKHLIEVLQRCEWIFGHTGSVRSLLLVREWGKKKALLNISMIHVFFQQMPSKSVVQMSMILSLWAPSYKQQAKIQSHGRALMENWVSVLLLWSMWSVWGKGQWHNIEIGNGQFKWGLFQGANKTCQAER